MVDCGPPNTKATDLQVSFCDPGHIINTHPLSYRGIKGENEKLHQFKNE